jgi:hypothetical protein
VRTHLGAVASRVGSWWGPALHELRAKHERETDEIDIVGLRRGRVSVVGECKWTSRPISTALLDEIERYKLPALLQNGLKTSKEGPLIVLFARSGFTERLEEIAEERELLRLVSLDELVPFR